LRPDVPERQQIGDEPALDEGNVGVRWFSSKPIGSSRPALTWSVREPDIDVGVSDRRRAVSWKVRHEPEGEEAGDLADAGADAPEKCR
jgi:hypothetical protein